MGLLPKQSSIIQVNWHEAEDRFERKVLALQGPVSDQTLLVDGQSKGCPRWLAPFSSGIPGNPGACRQAASH